VRPGAWASLASAALALLAWEAASRAGWLDPVLLSSPARMLAAGEELIASPLLARDLAFTTSAFAASLALAWVLGGGLGLLVGWSPWARALLAPFLLTAHALPKVVLLPVVVLWVGLGWRASLFLGTLMASFPILVATQAGVQGLARDYLVLARAYRAPPTLVLRRILLPGILPTALAGLRLGVHYALVGVLVAEFFAAGAGLGYRMNAFMANFEVDRFFAYMALVLALGAGVTALLRLLEEQVRALRPEGFPGGEAPA